MFFIFPYRIRRPFRMPWVTIGIMAACVIVYALQLLMGLERSLALLGFRPNATGAITWFSAMFAHAGLMHLLGNLYFLWIFGGVLEDTIGRARYLSLYLAGGLVAAIFHALMMLAFAHEQLMVPSVGASGAIAAVMGLSAIRFARLKLDVWYFFWMLVTVRTGSFGIPALTGVVLYLLREVWGGVTTLALGSSGVAHWAHVGGLLFGIGVAYAFGLSKELDREEAEREASGWAAVGRLDLAGDRMLPTTQGEIETALTRARMALERPLPDVAAAGVDLRTALRGLLNAGDRAGAARVYREFRRYADSPLLFDAPTLCALGSASESIGDHDAAARAYHDVLQLHARAPEAERALYRLSHVYLRQGKQADAQQTWETYRRAFPSSTWLAHADERLRAYA